MSRVRGRRWVVGAVSVVLAAVVGLVVVVTVSASSHGQPTAAERCHSIAIASEERRAAVAGSGPTVAVIGDSYSQGLGLADPRGSWPSRLDGTVLVDG